MPRIVTTPFIVGFKAIKKQTQVRIGALVCLNYTIGQSETRHSKKAVEIAIDVLIRKDKQLKKAHIGGNKLFYRVLTKYVES